MYFSPPYFFVLRKHFASLKRLFAYKPWLIFVVAVVLFGALTTTVVYEQYRMNRDNLIQYVPETAFLYMHANTNKQNVLFQDISRFISYHPRMMRAWGEAVSDQAGRIWPSIDSLKYHEIAFALIPDEETWNPALFLFLQDDEGVEEQADLWRREGWSVGRDDSIVIVSRLPLLARYRSNNPALSQKMVRQGYPLKNAFYVYIENNQFSQWLDSAADDALVKNIARYFSDKKGNTFLNLSVQESTVVVSEETSPFAPARSASGATWIDNMLFYQGVRLKQIDALPVVRFLLSAPGILKIGGIDDIRSYIRVWQQKYGYDILNDALLKISGPIDVFYAPLQKRTISAGSSADFIVSIPMDDTFSLSRWRAFLSQIAAFSYPVVKERVLPDKTRIKELVAELPSSAFWTAEEIVPGKVAYMLIVGEGKWPWVYMWDENILYVANNMRLLQSALGGAQKKKSDNNPCIRDSSQYALIDFWPILAKRLGLDEIGFDFSQEIFTLCVK